MARAATEPSAEAPASVCPASGDEATFVPWITVQALVSGPVPVRQTFRVCPGAGCDVVYFGDRGALVRLADLDVAPGFKVPGDEGMLCYCFALTRGDLRSVMRGGGAGDLIERIAADVRAGSCACEVRNPTGRCCLGDLRREARSAGAPEESGADRRGSARHG